MGRHLLPLSLLLTACGTDPISVGHYSSLPPTEFPQLISYSTPAQEVDIAIAEMELAQSEGFLHSPTGLKISMSFTSNYPANILGTTILGTQGTCTIEINKDLDPNGANTSWVRSLHILMLKAVIRHELGHCFGMQHVESPNDVMYAYLRLVDQTTEASLFEFNRRLKGKRHHE